MRRGLSRPRTGRRDRRRRRRLGRRARGTSRRRWWCRWRRLGDARNRRGPAKQQAPGENCERGGSSHHTSPSPSRVPWRDEPTGWSTRVAYPDSSANRGGKDYVKNEDVIGSPRSRMVHCAISRHRSGIGEGSARIERVRHRRPSPRTWRSFEPRANRTESAAPPLLSFLPPADSGERKGRVAPGYYSPRAPTDPYVHFRAYGSSCHVLATRRYTE